MAVAPLLCPYSHPAVCVCVCACVRVCVCVCMCVCTHTHSLSLSPSLSPTRPFQPLGTTHPNQRILKLRVYWAPLLNGHSALLNAYSFLLSRHLSGYEAFVTSYMRRQKHSGKMRPARRSFETRRVVGYRPVRRGEISMHIHVYVMLVYIRIHIYTYVYINHIHVHIYT